VIRLGREFRAATTTNALKMKLKLKHSAELGRRTTELPQGMAVSDDNPDAPSARTDWRAWARQRIGYEKYNATVQLYALFAVRQVIFRISCRSSSIASSAQETYPGKFSTIVAKLALCTETCQCAVGENI
jgi:hypothetical protein